MGQQPFGDGVTRSWSAGPLCCGDCPGISPRTLAGRATTQGSIKVGRCCKTANWTSSYISLIWTQFSSRFCWRIGFTGGSFWYNFLFHFTTLVVGAVVLKKKHGLNKYDIHIQVCLNHKLGDMDRLPCIPLQILHSPHSQGHHQLPPPHLRGRGHTK